MNPLLTAGLDAHRGVTALSVNVNKVALLRNTRALGIPSVLRAAEIMLESGAHGVTVHPRPDERHIRPHDVRELAALMKDWPQAEYNIEGNPLHNLMDFVRDLSDKGMRPQQVTFVPDSVDQPTSDHGWRLPDDAQRLAPLIQEAKRSACVSACSWTRNPTPWPPFATSAPTASNSTPSLTPARSVRPDSPRFSVPSPQRPKPRCVRAWASTPAMT